MNSVDLDTAFNGAGFIKYADVRDLVGNRVTARLIDNNIYEPIKATPGNSYLNFMEIPQHERS